MAVDVVALNPDGTVVFADGSVAQLVGGRNSFLGYRLLDQDVVPAQAAGVDQIGQAPVPSLRALGLDQG